MAKSDTVQVLEIHDAPERPPEHGEMTTACYENHVPQFVAAELDKRYGSLFSSLRHFELRGRLTNRTSTYVTRRGSQVHTILLFEIDNGKLKVLNELIRITEEEIRCFADHVFSSYKSVRAISFHAVQTCLERFSYPHQRFYCAEDIVISLHDRADAYLRSLSKNMRRNLRRYSDALMHSHPSYAYRVVPENEVDDHLIRSIIDFNKERMADKNKTFALNAEDSEWIIALTKACGLVGVVTINGRICAGAVCCRVAGNYYMQVIGHDPRYNEFSLGTLCCYRTIRECIDRGGKQLHFLWGRLDYKYALLGVQQEYDQLDIYRSHVHVMRDAKAVAKTALTGYMREAKFWLLGCERRNDVKSRAATRLLNLLRWSKRTAVTLISKAR